MSEEAKQELNNAINAIGALCEIAGFLKKQLIAHGFTKAEAFRICEDYVINSMCKKSGGE